MPAWRIVATHILPNTLSTVITATTFGIPQAILAEATLSFIGMGISPPLPSWGQMVSDNILKVIYGLGDPAYTLISQDQPYAIRWWTQRPARPTRPSAPTCTFSPSSFLLKDAAYIPLYYLYAVNLFKPTVQGIPTNKAGLQIIDNNIYRTMKSELFIVEE